MKMKGTQPTMKVETGEMELELELEMELAQWSIWKGGTLGNNNKTKTRINVLWGTARHGTTPASWPGTSPRIRGS